MIRKIIKIDEEKCNGCGLCAAACHEGAIGMAGGKAKLLREDYCDGLGDCLPACPANAISFETREAPAYDAAAVARAKAQTLPCGCPSAQSKKIERRSAPETANEARSELSQWPVQIKLVPVNAPYFQGARLLVAADCTAYACGDFHGRFIRGRVTLVGCPKLDMADYSEKLSEILKANDILSLTLVRMEVPCCGKMESALCAALENSGKNIPFEVYIVSTDGKVFKK